MSYLYIPVLTFILLLFIFQLSGTCIVECFGFIYFWLEALKIVVISVCM